MGIDIYATEIYEPNNKKHQDAFYAACAARDKAATEQARKKAQGLVNTLFEAMYSVGYLRESYHGGPYVTRFLVSEAFDSDEGEARIPAATLRERLPAAVLMAIYRNHAVYGEGNPGIIALDEGGEVITKTLATIFAQMPNVVKGSLEAGYRASMTDEQLRAARELIDRKLAPPCAEQFIEFVEQCEAHEQATGQPTLIRASY